MKNEATGLARLISATRFSIAGLKATFQSEQAFRQEVIVFFLLVPLAIIIADNSIEFALLSASILLLLIVELLNTGIEHVVDRIGADYHELSGKAKDAGSAAVLLTVLFVLIIWGSIIIG